MGTKFKEVNTLSFIGNVGLKTQRVWKEVDEAIDIIGCKEKFDRPCQLIKPLSILEKDLPPAMAILDKSQFLSMMT